MSFTIDQIRGCLIGGAIGDALGNAYEGQPGPIQVNWNPPWRLSDDTQLTLATCEAIVASGTVDPANIAQRMASRSFVLLINAVYRTLPGTETRYPSIGFAIQVRPDRQLLSGVRCGS